MAAAGEAGSRSARVIALGLALLALPACTPEEREPQTFTSTYVARWNLNYGEYQVDIGQYLDALEAFDTAIEMTDDAEVQTEAWLQKATVLALFLDDPGAALRAYEELITRHPKSAAADAALFRAAMVLFDDGDYGRAATYFERYLAEVPDGPSRGSAEFMLEQCRAKRDAAPSPTVAAAASRRPTRTNTVAPTAPPTRTEPRPTRPSEPPPAPRAPPASPTPRPASPTATAPRRAAPPSPATGPSLAQVRVRIFKGKSRVTVDSESAVTTIPALAAGGGLDLAARAGTVSVNGGPGIRELKIASATPLRLQAGSAVRHYRGSLVVTAEGNTLQLINHVGIEDYLYGVVTKESVASWPNEALKTQAVASRTYALYQAQHRKSRAWDMVDDEGSQVYGGVEGESAAAHRAVDETRGIVVTYKGRPIYAMFTSNTGWHTGDPKFIFDQPLAYLTAVPDPYSPNQQLGRWKRSHGAAEVRSRLAAIGVKLGTIRAIEPRLTDPSGRIVRVAIVDERGAHEMRTRPTLARALALPEILLDVQREGDGFVFAGGGFGHGVGLSQWGAKDMADKGFGVREILAFYYRNTEIGVADP